MRPSIRQSAAPRSWTPSTTASSPSRRSATSCQRTPARRPSCGDLSDLGICIIPGRLYWQCRDVAPPSREDAFYFCVDGALVYEPFFADFGPLSLGQTYRYCQLLEKYMSQPDLENKAIVHYCSMAKDKRANAAVLMACYRIIVEGLSAAEAIKPFEGIEPPFAGFRDATCGVCHYLVTLKDCAEGLQFAMKQGWFNYRTFNAEEFEYMEKVENGDRSWLVPGKFLAFAGPHAKTVDDEGYPVWTPEKYVPHFKQAGIGLVVRLNHKVYDAQRFIQQGIRHLDLYFVDGSCPSPDIVQRFFDAVNCERQGVAIHCKAGLGRTGTLIGLWCMQEVGFPARAFIAWSRLCRPGSILGPQQQYLCEMEREFLGGAHVRYQAQPALRDGLRAQKDGRRSDADDLSRSSTSLGGFSHQLEAPSTPARYGRNEWSSSSPSSQSPVGLYGDKGQGERLCNAKRVGGGLRSPQGVGSPQGFGMPKGIESRFADAGYPPQRR